ncbi:MAG TPA: thioredoxin domain-containing protein [Candidatus Paceibacterota bacterium]|nr:thioredoxin domain-containing protein [Candidatus Paceibacterota bacterium]
MDNPTRSPWLIPSAIIIAGVILALTVFVIRSGSAGPPATPMPEMIEPVAVADHIIGNPEAPVTIVEYSDIDSDDGKSFHAALAQLMTEYAPDGKVALVYRHLPLTTVHEFAQRHAEAAECAASLGRADSFWRFIDQAHTLAPGGAELNPTSYPSIAAALGIEEGTFTECVNSGRFSAKVRAQAHDALGAGAEGAPFTVLLIKGAKPVAINGALPYTALKELVDRSLAKVK